MLEMKNGYFQMTLLLISLDGYSEMSVTSIFLSFTASIS